MILVKLRGGLSNQMFQYAAARRLAAAHNTSVRIDTSWYDNIPSGATPRTYELHNLHITGTRATVWETIGTDGLRHTALHAVPVALYRKVRPRYRFIGERHFHFDPQVLTLPDNVCLFGYWTSERYFADAAAILRLELQFRNAPSPENKKWLRLLDATASVAIHVRRGDYASDPAIAAIFGQLPLDYYNTCITRIRQILPEPTFFVFSDDLDWAREHLPAASESSYHYVDHNTGADSYEDLRLMSSARHQIIANSTFSWWAAWLNPNPDKIVYAPRRWLQDKSYDTSDVLPPGWLPV